jgi:hypothetical protein
MTEEEAKEKWCPMAGQRPLAEHEKCVASECMMWRWNTAGFKYCDGDRVDVPSKTDGYCGLGGKP